ncbi:MAG: prolyl oligopeptidase family serine peptidase [Verrucomicrobiae bacterium]|nr:prolyl oligopeptidase family serine peptidase [Verrucomicrobiae bacterium]
MTRAFIPLLLAGWFGMTGSVKGQEIGGIPPIERRLPPPGIEIPAETLVTFDKRLEEFLENAWSVGNHPLAPDVEVFGKAVKLALRHGEIYSEKELPLLTEMLDLGEERLAQLEKETTPWTDQRGLVVRGYRSRIDGSVQPYGIEIPEKLDLTKPVPMLVWLHGRGDKTTDIHFIKRCLGKSQALGGKVPDQQEAIIVHPFGRHCVGWKHAGEIDVFEVIEQMKAHYPIDPDRIALAGFSMGGAGAWHIGAHYTDHFCAIHTGAGFAETARYNGLTPETYPSIVEQTLWKVYDVPNYVRNFSNVPFLAYSGEVDKQKQAADLMAEAFAAEGMEMRHVIGPGMGHKYHDDSVKEIWAWLEECWKKGRPKAPKSVHLQTETPRYGKMFWVRALGQEKIWQDTRIDAEKTGASEIELKTKNVALLQIDDPEGKDLAGTSLTLDGQKLKVESPGFPVSSVRLQKADNGSWEWGEPEALRKVAGLQGPIDDAFLEPFVVAGQSSPSANAKVERWTKFEFSHFAERWLALMRGELPVRDVEEVNSVDVKEKNLILWGDPTTNPLIAEMADGLPVKWEDGKIRLGDQSWSAADHVAAFVFPNPLNPERYVVINSGLTFREGHDRTNSLQNPKLGDWAIIALDTDPDAEKPGRIEANGFFDVDWKPIPSASE